MVYSIESALINSAEHLFKLLIRSAYMMNTKNPNNNDRTPLFVITGMSLTQGIAPIHADEERQNRLPPLPPIEKE